MAIVDWSDAESKFGDVVAVSNGNGASASNFCALGQFEVIGENTNGEESPLGFVFMIP
jgi:hypothetical protein